MADIGFRIIPSSKAGNGPGLGWRAAILLSIAFVASRLAYSAAGLRFRDDTIQNFAQLLDPPLLQNRLVESLWHLHAQPPLFNFLTGIALKLSPQDPGFVLGPLFLATGLVSCLLLASILRRLGFSIWIASALALLYACTPAFILYENWYFYPHLEQALLIAAAWCFFKDGAGAGAWLGGAFALLAALVLLHSLFHPLFLLFATIAVAVLLPRGKRMRAVRLAAIPLAVVFLWAAKNWFLFGFFGTSSWGGNSLHGMMTEIVPRERIESMISRGILPRLSREWEFSAPEIYIEVLGKKSDQDWHVPALDETKKSETRENPVNYNHWIYPIASKIYRHAALRMMREDPGAYGKSIAWTAHRYLEPTTDDLFLEPNRHPIRTLARSWEAFETNPLVLILGFAALLAAIIVVFRGRGPAGERIFLGFIAGAVLWTAACGILLEFGENNRFRYPVQSLTDVLVAWVCLEGVQRLRSLWAKAPLLGD
ncbi:MAG TPA: hypothetical protein VFR10_00865 [bacterium]|nr:hypothetical protein [bacterium]